MIYQNNKKRIHWFTLPAYGHTYPILPLVRELSKKYDVVIWTSREFREVYSGYNIRLEYYPEDINWDFPSSGLLLYREMIQYAKKIYTEKIDVDLSSDIYIADSTSFWVHAFSKKNGIPVLSYVLTSIIQGKSLLSPFLGEFSRKYIFSEFIEGSRSFASVQKSLREWESITNTKSTLFGLMSGDGSYSRKVILTDPNLVFPQSEKNKALCIGPSVDFERQNNSTDIQRSNLEIPLVYISLGTVYNNNDILIQKIINIAPQINADFLISTGGNTVTYDIPDSSNKIILCSYVNQVDILSQANLFITHGGINSIHEALYFNMQLIVHPKGVDQPYIADMLIGKGLAKGISPKFSKKKIKLIIEDSLENNKRHNEKFFETFRKSIRETTALFEEIVSDMLLREHNIEEKKYSENREEI